MPATKRLAGMARSYKLFSSHQPPQGGIPFPCFMKRSSPE
jgi:hypothetical protein